MPPIHADTQMKNNSLPSWGWVRRQMEWSKQRNWHVRKPPAHQETNHQGLWIAKCLRSENMYRAWNRLQIEEGKGDLDSLLCACLFGWWVSLNFLFCVSLHVCMCMCTCPWMVCMCTRACGNQRTVLYICLLSIIHIYWFIYFWDRISLWPETHPVREADLIEEQVLRILLFPTPIFGIISTCHHAQLFPWHGTSTLLIESSLRSDPPSLL